MLSFLILIYSIQRKNLASPSPGKVRAAPMTSQRLFANTLIALVGTGVIFLGYQLWAEKQRAEHESCTRAMLESECAWELRVGLPVSLTFWLFLLWQLCLPLSSLLPSLISASRELPYHPTRRTYYVRLIKAIAIFYVMLYPAVHHIYFLLISRDSAKSFPARFSAFLLRQVSVMCALFAVVFNWTRRQRDSLAAQLYWCALALVYVLQASLTSWHAHNATLSNAFYTAFVPHFALVACFIYRTYSLPSRWHPPLLLP